MLNYCAMFIHYSRPEDLTDWQNRVQVNSHLSRRKANKTKSLKKRSLQLRPQIRPSATPDQKQLSPRIAIISQVDEQRGSVPANRNELQSPSPPGSIPHDLGGFRADPFACFPITTSDLAVWAVDFCEFENVEIRFRFLRMLSDF